MFVLTLVRLDQNQRVVVSLFVVTEDDYEPVDFVRTLDVVRLHID